MKNKKGKNKVTLACSECFARNYIVNKSLGTTEKLELKKYCKSCNKITLHKETK
ncbi:50S ribosomal protein L33 [Candidatus Hepatoplasma crinochetorum]|jgi:large subunit ribosomal protein L33|uniref:Large ribosomal subunit protein bL33 n=1 Tax=Candidatus Hepatoplasma crinochetorum Av TaxID=1427984 RepID=W8GFP6_9MOLU|nr:50S ribosomal protein L33 [Candidatus Hepatoplasma crinochetorum]AHK22609.1 50S ribosomal protein L33 1 [Candidatus Hepatoplasma crinochetorum Av]BDV03190.1 MAG: 50S ribosomal protein L33 2 [Candidatus Hepatoplasma crinochetorum]